MTAALISVEVDGLVAGARSVGSRVGDGLTTAVVGTICALQECGSMAGSDPAGLAWAGVYDRVVPQVLGAAQDGINACFALSSRIAQTGLNYAGADHAATPSAGALDHDAAAARALIRQNTPIGLAIEVPSAAGGSSSPPPGWGLIVSLVEGLWPTGHPGRLRAAARAWTRCAGELFDRSEWLVLPASVAAEYGLLEAGPMGRDSLRLYTALRELSAQHRALAQAGTDLAEHIEGAHAEVEGELRSLLEWTAAIEAAGAVASIFSFGSAQVPTQLAESARLAAVAARVSAVIERCAALARATAATLATATEAVNTLAAELRLAANLRLVTPALETTYDLPVLSAARALTRLRRSAALESDLSDLLVTPRQLQKKFKHARDFGVTANWGKRGAESFAKAMTDFLKAPSTERIAAGSGRYHGAPAILNYNIRTGQVIVQHPNGAFWTCETMSPKQAWNVVRRASLGGSH